MPNDQHPRVAMLGSYIPRRCGIATFTNDLASAMANEVYGSPLAGDSPVSIVAMTDRGGEYDYPPEVMLEIGQHKRDDYRSAAEMLNHSRVDVVSLQHEFGLFGGEAGEYLLDFIDRLRKPLVTTLHTVLIEPTPKQREVFERICARSARVVVMAERARTIMHEVNDIPHERIHLIHHGVPDVPFGDTEPFKERFDLRGRPMILTFGLLSPGKGIETMLEALAKVVPQHRNVAYVVLGVTHPGVRRESGEEYRISLETRAMELGIQKNVQFHNRYVTSTDLREYLQAADLYCTPYRAKQQITSGTLAYALASGKAIVSTPYWHAEELLADGRGRFFDFDDEDTLAGHLNELLSDKTTRDTVRRAAYDHGRQMTWKQVAGQYVETFAEAKRRAATATAVEAPREAVMRLSLPEPRLDHLFKMTDDTALLQHAIFATPDRRHGYCTDDNARALIVASMAWSQFKDERVLRYLHVYLAFLHFAFRPETGRFRNFMAYDRSWLEDDGSDDSQGRALWALGHLVTHAPNASDVRLATDLFHRALGLVDTLEFPRSWSFATLGLHYYLRRFGDDAEVRRKMTEVAERINDRFVQHETDEWPWFEDEVTYDNGRIPQALIIAGQTLNRPDYTERGIRVLNWLLRVQTAEAGHLSIVGNEGWLKRGGERPEHDQQPLEPAALIGACKAAFRASGETRWLDEMRRSFEWYLGRNDARASLVDYKSRGCFDGLTPTGPNENQGAESVLSWLLSLLIMHEMQTGDAPEVG